MYLRPSLSSQLNYIFKYRDCYCPNGESAHFVFLKRMVGGMLSAMRLLLTVLTDSLIIWTRNFTLIYIFLLSLFILAMILPEGLLPAWEWRWLLLFFISLLVVAAISAGWFNMVAAACTRFLGRPREEALRDASPMAAFALYKEFFPGVARYFPSMAGGLLIHGIAIFLLFAAIQPLWASSVPVLEKLVQLDFSQREAAIQALSFDQQLGIGELFLAILAGLFVYTCFSLLFMLWPAFVVYYDETPLKAFWRAFMQYIKDPLRMLGLSGLFLLSGITVYVLTGFSALAGPFVFLIFQLGLLLMLVYMAIATFVYVYHAVGKPVEHKEDTAGRDSIEEPPTL